MHETKGQGRTTCALDVADRGGTTLEDLGALLNMTRERVRQIEIEAIEKIHRLRLRRDDYT